MFVTEQQAKEKWCPHVQVQSLSMKVEEQHDLGTKQSETTEIQYQSNRGESQIDITALNTHCIGSACMAWRRDTRDDTLGYCGLAGRPMV